MAKKTTEKTDYDFKVIPKPDDFKRLRLMDQCEVLYVLFLALVQALGARHDVGFSAAQSLAAEAIKEMAINVHRHNATHEQRRLRFQLQTLGECYLSLASEPDFEKWQSILAEYKRRAMMTSNEVLTGSQPSVL